MNWCGIHKSLQIGSNTCLHCKIERLEAEIQADKDLQFINTKNLTHEQWLQYPKLRENMIKTHIALMRMCQ